MLKGTLTWRIISSVWKNMVKELDKSARAGQAEQEDGAGRAGGRGRQSRRAGRGR